MNILEYFNAILRKKYNKLITKVKKTYKTSDNIWRVRQRIYKRHKHILILNASDYIRNFAKQRQFSYLSVHHSENILC
jgi:hypothetical protein